MPERELSLDEKKAIAQGDFNKEVRELGLENSPIFMGAVEKMKGMEHGPNHKEGDPKVHTELVLHEISTYLQTQEHGLGTEDVKVLKLAALLHDVGKAETQQFDVASSKQNETIGASEEQIAEAQKLKDGILAELYAKDGGGPLKGKKLEEKYAAKLQEVLKERRSELGESSIAMPANFRGHAEKSVEMTPKIISESKMDLNEGQQKDLIFVVDNHMLVLEPEKLQLKKFKELFVGSDGKVNEQKIDLLKIMAMGDNLGTIGKDNKSKNPNILAEFNGAIDKLKTEFKNEAEAENKKKEEKEFEEKIFGGTMNNYVTEKGKKGSEIKKAGELIKNKIKELKGVNPNITPEELRTEIDKLSL